MAKEAHKEPTMEEILASIRKIISDDTPAAPPAENEVGAADFTSSDIEDDVFEPLTEAADDSDDDSIFDETESLEDVEALVDDEVEAETTVFEPLADESAELEEAPSFEELLDAAKESEADTEADVDVEEVAAEAPEPVVEEVEITETQADEEEPVMSSPAYNRTVLAGDDTASAAAGAIGKLIQTAGESDTNTIDGLVRELLRPMLKEWLDENLPGIVEEKVEAEVQRIARMAR